MAWKLLGIGFSVFLSVFSLAQTEPLAHLTLSKNIHLSPVSQKIRLNSLKTINPETKAAFFCDGGQVREDEFSNRERLSKNKCCVLVGIDGSDDLHGDRPFDILMTPPLQTIEYQDSEWNKVVNAAKIRGATLPPRTVDRRTIDGDTSSLISLTTIQNGHYQMACSDLKEDLIVNEKIVNLVMPTIMAPVSYEIPPSTGVPKLDFLKSLFNGLRASPEQAAVLKDFNTQESWERDEEQRLLWIISETNEEHANEKYLSDFFRQHAAKNYSIGS